MSSPRTEHRTITLRRGATGFGFNIVGGVDNPCYPGDNAIYVAKIREKESAAIDGRLKVGDKILQAGGVSLVNVEHDKAAQVFKTIRNDVLVLQIERQSGGDLLLFTTDQSSNQITSVYSEKPSKPSKARTFCSRRFPWIILGTSVTTMAIMVGVLKRYGGVTQPFLYHS